METLHAGVITLLRSTLNCETLKLPESFDWDEAYNILYNHHLVGLGLQGAARCGAPRTHPAVTRLTAMFCSDLRVSRNQMQKIREVCALFDANGIEYLPVKGAVIKSLYPRPEYRVMGDADILIRQEQYPLIRSLLPSLGMKEKDNSDYEYTWECPELTLELHRHLVSQHFRNYFTYYRDSWQFARKEENSTRYFLSPEDHFIYLIVHFAKHYLNGTICAKDICDFYVWRQAHPHMDGDYILRQLHTLQLADFYRNVQDLLDNWFKGAPATEATELITRSAFQGGVHDEFNRSVADNVMRRHTDDGDPLLKMKIIWFFRALFPSRITMSYTYPVLTKCPVLLPVFWVVRWFNALFRDRDRLKRGMIVMKMDKGDLLEYESHMTTVGLSPERH